MTRLPLLALALLVVPSATAYVDHPLFNPDFDVGHPVAVRAAVASRAFDGVGSALPGATDPNADRPAAGWTWRPFSGEHAPAGTATWVHAGALDLRILPGDEGPATPVLAQASGQRPDAGLWRDPQRVVLDVRYTEHAPVTVRALYAAVEDPWALRASDAVTIPPYTFGRFTLEFPPEAEGTMTEFMLAFAAEGRTGRLILESVDVQGATRAPRTSGG